MWLKQTQNRLKQLMAKLARTTKTCEIVRIFIEVLQFLKCYVSQQTVKSVSFQRHKGGRLPGQLTLQRPLSVCSILRKKQKDNNQTGQKLTLMNGGAKYHGGLFVRADANCGGFRIERMQRDVGLRQRTRCGLSRLAVAVETHQRAVSRRLPVPRSMLTNYDVDLLYLQNLLIAFFFVCFSSFLFFHNLNFIFWFEKVFIVISC